MGVAGCGKTTVAEHVSYWTDLLLLDADKFHSKANKKKMASGVPLEDADRWPWLDKMNAKLREYQRLNLGVVLACSALKRTYRQRLSDGVRVRWIYLRGSRETLLKRLKGRKNHYMKAEMLDSQLRTLEEPSPDEKVTTYEIDGSPSSSERIASLIIARVRK